MVLGLLVAFLLILSPGSCAGAVSSNRSAVCLRWWMQVSLAAGSALLWDLMTSGVGTSSEVTAGQAGPRGSQPHGRACPGSWGSGHKSMALQRAEARRMAHTVFGLHTLIPGGQSCIVGTKKSENTKSIQTIFFLFGQPFCFVELWPDQHAEPRTELEVSWEQEESWLVWTFCTSEGRGFITLYETLSKPN